MTLVERIKKIAKQKNMNLKETAIKAGIGENSIYRWKDQNPTSESLSKVADVLGVSVDYLLNGKDNEPENNVDIRTTGLFRKTVDENDLSEKEQESLARDMDAYLKFRAEQLKKSRG